MGAHLSREDLESLGENMTRDSLKKGVMICFAICLGMRILWMF
jgi:hypothetical protein